MSKAKSIKNKQLDLDVNGFNIKSDLPKNWGGDNLYPDPLTLLQAALLSCATTHAMLFTDKIGIDRAQVTLDLEPVFNENNEIIEATILVYVPANFPADKETALTGAVHNCVVGRHVKFPRNVVVVKQ